MQTFLVLPKRALWDEALADEEAQANLKTKSCFDLKPTCSLLNADLVTHIVPRA